MARKPRPTPEELARERDEQISRLCRWYCATLFALDEMFDETWRMVERAKPGGPFAGLIRWREMADVGHHIEVALGHMANYPPAVLGPLRFKLN